MKYFVIYGFIISLKLFSTIQTEDLGSIPKKPKEATPPSEVVVDYSKLKGEPKSSTAAVKKAEKFDPFLDDDSSQSMLKDSEKHFFRSLGNITIRASEQYVYIRAGKSAIIMNNDGKIVIDSDQDLIFTSNKSIILKAKQDIILQPGGKLDVPNSKDLTERSGSTQP